MSELNRVVAVCGSSRAGTPNGKSLTQRMLDHFLKGLAPQECTVFYPHRMDIAYCTGCLTCWFKTPGVCAINDDMTAIREAMDKSDLIILASPVYVDGFSAQTKVVLDRMICALDPLISVDSEGHCRHDLLRQNQPTALLISCCGFAEADNFDQIHRHFKAICRNLSWRDGGAVLLPAGGLAFVPQKYDHKFAAIEKAGEEMAKDGKISLNTAEFISREMVSAVEYQAFLNSYFTKLKKTP